MDGRSASEILTGKPTCERCLGRPWRKWDNITIDKEIGINRRNWIDSAEDRDYWRVSGFNKACS